ncbi:MAG: hypothetical protein HY665_07860 [Chloroflexi bacterium]|nr:hypothetical protein [Chloroflexota bacterium]
MAEFLTTAETEAKIEEIINSSKKTLVLICPFIKIPGTLLQNIEVAARQNIKVTLVYGKRELSSDERSQLKEIENLSLYFLENLHAKCFFNDEAMVITSYNLYDASAQNREMGVLISRNGDPTCFREAVEEARRIVLSATKDETESTEHEPRSRSRNQRGFCIRCGASVKYDLERPLCLDCFRGWSEWRNPDYEEKLCHHCGKSAPTTKARPLCDSCYRELKS